MRRESLPDIPRREHPEHDPLKKAAETAVVEKVAELRINLDLRRHPEIRSRLAELGEHFEDSLAMAQIVQKIYGPLKERLGLEDEKPDRLMRAAVLHDIGKSGPAGKETDFHYAVRRLFIAPKHPFNAFAESRKKTVREFVAEQDLADTDRVLEALRSAGIEPDKEPMIDFWHRHAAWTYDILKHETGADIDADTVSIASSHHLLENQNPARLDLEHVPSEAHVLEVMEMSELLAAVDKYQAYRDRGKLKHEEAMAQLTRVLQAKKDLPEALRQKFQAVIDVLTKSKEEMETFFSENSKEQ